MYLPISFFHFSLLSLSIPRFVSSLTFFACTDAPSLFCIPLLFTFSFCVSTLLSFYSPRLSLPLFPSSLFLLLFFLFHFPFIFVLFLPPPLPTRVGSSFGKCGSGAFSYILHTAAQLQVEALICRKALSILSLLSCSLNYMDSHNNHHAFLPQYWTMLQPCFQARRGRRESAWYTLFAHVRNYNLGMRLYWTIVFTFPLPKVKQQHLYQLCVCTHVSEVNLLQVMRCSLLSIFRLCISAFMIWYIHMVILGMQLHSQLQILIACSLQKWRGKAWEILSHAW